MKKYSIILPVRNGGEYVKECVNSILSQTFAEFDLHVLDNCSSDGTLNWITSLKDERIIVIPSEKPLTIEDNWARILSIKRNEFITLIGHDDLLDTNYLEVMDKLIAENPDASLYQAHFRYIDAAGNFKRHCKPMDKIQYVHEFIGQQFFKTFDSMGTGYMMRSKDYDSLGGIPPYPNLIFADYELWVRLIALSYKATTHKECFSYREHNSVSRTTGETKYQEAFGRYVSFIKQIKDKDQTINEIVKRYGYSFLIYHCESLSHRLLKTPVKDRNLKVKEFINKCIHYAEMLIPGQAFEPRKVFRIKIAEHFDNSQIGRGIFKLYKAFSF